MHLPKKCTVIKSLLLPGLLSGLLPGLLSGSLLGLMPGLMLTGAMAADVTHVDAGIASVIRTSGPLLATRPDGTSKILAPNSTVEPGDTLLTQKNGYAQIKFSDNSQVILQPDTTFTIDRFSYDAAKPEADDAAFTLQRGGVRMNAGLLGKRSKERVVLSTPVATIGLQNASAIVQYRAPDASAKVVDQAAAQLDWLMASSAALESSLSGSSIGNSVDSDMPPAMAIRPMMLAVATSLPTAPGLAPGLYVQVLDGLINVTNPTGTANFAAGQFGFTPNFQQPPVVLPQNPGLQFTPPPAFSAPVSSGASGSTASKSAAVDCEVR
jgi:hypothetical protein